MTGRAFRRAFVLAVAALVLSAAVHAADARHGKKKHFLWKVSSRTATIYLAGSIHIMRQSDYPLDPVYENAYNDSGAVYFEINPNGMDEQSIRQLTLDKGMYPAMQSLSTALSGSAYEEVKPTLSSIGLSIEQAERMRPWLLGLAIAVGELQRLGYDPDHGMDRYFMNRAARDGKKTGGFETVDYQLSLLANMPDAVQEQMLLQTLQDLQETEANYREMTAAWKTGDTDRMDAFLLQSFRAYPSVYERLIVERNRAWVSAIERLLREKENHLVVVGAAHMVGKDGIIAALRQKGYPVQQQ